MALYSLYCAEVLLRNCSLIALRIRSLTAAVSTGYTVTVFSQVYFETREGSYLTDPGNAREYKLATSSVLQCVLTEKEVNVVIHVERPNEFRI